MHLRDFQARHGLSLTALAAMLGRPVSTVHAWLHGHRRPDRASMQAIAQTTAGAVTANDFHGLAEAQAPFLVEAGAEKARRWAEDNAEAIAAHARAIEEGDTPLAKYRMF